MFRIYECLDCDARFLKEAEFWAHLETHKGDTMTNTNNKTTRHVDRLTELYEHQASDYFRRRNQRRVAYDICLFFLAGAALTVLVWTGANL